MPWRTIIGRGQGEEEKPVVETKEQLKKEGPGELFLSKAEGTVLNAVESAQKR